MFAQQTRVLAGALMGALVAIAAVMYVVLAATEDALAPPPLWLVAAQLVAGLAAHGLCESVGYRTQPLDPALDPEEARTVARARFQAGMVVRFAACEVVAIASLAAAFVVAEGGWLGYVTGAAVSLVLMAVHVWPWRRPVDRTRAALESDGAASGLRADFGLPVARPGPIQEL
jgi:hypothetical protein